MTHVWQIAHSKFLPGTLCQGAWDQIRHTFGANIYEPGAPGPSWDSFNNEQQGAIVDRWFGFGCSIENALFQYMPVITGGLMPPIVMQERPAAHTAVSWGKDRLDIFVRGTDGAVYHKAWDGKAWFPSDQPDGWNLIGGSTIGAPVAVSWGKDRLDLFVRGTDNGIYHKAWDGMQWFPSDAADAWNNIGGQTTDNPAVVSWGKDRLDVFVRGMDGAIYHKAWDRDHWFPSDDPNIWERIGGATIGEPVAVSWGENRLDLFVRGTNGGIFHKAWDTDQWFPSDKEDGWDNLGGMTKGTPSVVSWEKGRLDICACGLDMRLYQKAWANNQWFPSGDPNDWKLIGGRMS
jgi:hypothetical protein